MDKYKDIIKEKYNLDTCEIIWSSGISSCEQKVIVSPDINELTQSLIEDELDEMYEEFCGEKTIAFFLVYNKSEI